MRGSRRATTTRAAAFVTGVLISGVLVACALSGCAATGGGSSPAPTTGPPISGRSIAGNWHLLHGADPHGAIVPGTANVTLRVDGTNSGGHGPCNAYGAVASSATTGALTIKLGITTEMACAQASLNVTEQHYFAALGAIRSAALANGRLTLAGGGDTLVFGRATQ